MYPSRSSASPTVSTTGSFDAHPNGLFRLVFPIFTRMMRKEEAQNIVHLKAQLESMTAPKPTDAGT
jgi:hypothetical protein